MRSFRPYGEVSDILGYLCYHTMHNGVSLNRRFKTGYIPKDAHDIVALAKMIGICTSEGIVTLDPTK